jgi:transposase-like protein
LSKLAEWIATTVAETLATHAFLSARWQRIHTNNPLEHLSLFPRHGLDRS